MNNKTVKELKTIAKSKKIKGYYKMRKAQLIDVLHTPNKFTVYKRFYPLLPKPKIKLTYKKGYPTRVSNSTTPIIDEPLPDINTPIMKPQPIVKVPPKLKTLASRVAKQVKRKKDELVDMFSSKVPPAPIIDEPTPVISTPVMKPKPIGKVPPKLKTLASRVVKQVKRKKDELADLFSSKVPPPPTPQPIQSPAPIIDEAYT